MLVDATLLVLAGGESRRMGRPKAWLKVGETFLLRCVTEGLAPVFSEVLISFAGPNQLERAAPYPVVFDRKPSAGPLGGLEAGLVAARYDVMFALGCDMPYVTRSTAEHAVAAARGRDAAIPRHEGRPEPICAAYCKTALPAITAAIDAGELKASEVSEHLRVTWLEGLDPAQFKSLNTPEDLERFQLTYSSAGRLPRS